jgi:hypothetical protein
MALPGCGLLQESSVLGAGCGWRNSTAGHLDFAIRRRKIFAKASTQGGL